jgi:hypothetical protein
MSAHTIRTLPVLNSLYCLEATAMSDSVTTNSNRELAYEVNSPQEAAAANTSAAIWTKYGEEIAKLGSIRSEAAVVPLTIDFSSDLRNPATGAQQSRDAMIPTRDQSQEASQRGNETPEQRIRYLEQTYNVRIARDGETLPGPTVNPVTARTPTMHELTGLEAALRQSQPSYPTSENQPLNIIFGRGRQPGDGARYGNNIYIFTDGRPERPATIEEAQAIQDSQGLPNLPSSIQHIAMHELAHRGQETVGNDDAAAAALAAELGFDMRLRDSFFNPRQYRMQGRDGFRYELSRDFEGRAEWLRMNTDGQYVDAKGNVAYYPEAERLTNAQMRERALVAPISNYFDNPFEMMAESTYFFRGNERSRLELLHRSPNLYHATRANDQREIDLIHGTKNGNSLMIRMPNGRLAINSMANRLAIAEFEAQRPR